MSFRCQFCMKSSEPYEKKILVVAAVRPFGDYGTQIAGELAACPRCVATATGLAPRNVGPSAESDLAEYKIANT